MEDMEALRDSFSPPKIPIYLKTRNEQMTNLQNFLMKTKDSSKRNTISITNTNLKSFFRSGPKKTKK
jgi:hypothetical protein